MKNKIFKIIYWFTIIICLHISVTSIIQAIKCSKMTQSELFLNIPNSFMLNWNKCK